MEKTLSVSVAAYNVEKYIRETLDCFLVPDIMDDLEILMVNDGSKDSTPEICDEYVRKYPETFVLVNKENGGWGSTVNKGIEVATGKYFKQLDGDDYFDRGMLTDFVRILKEHDEDLIYTNYRSFDDETGKLIENVEVPNKSLVNKHFDLDELGLDRMNFTLAMHACTFRTAMLQEFPIDITEHCFYTDIEYLLKALLRVKTVFFYPISVYCYRLGREGQSASVTGFRKHYKEHLAVTLKLLNIYGSLSVNDNLKDLIFRRIKEMVDYQYYVFLNLEPTAEHAAELREYNNTLKLQYPAFYKTDKKRVKAFRLLGNRCYSRIVYK